MRLPSTVVVVGLLYAADAPPTPIMSYYSILNVSLHFKVRVIFPGGVTLSLRGFAHGNGHFRAF